MIWVKTHSTRSGLPNWNTRFSVSAWSSWKDYAYLDGNSVCNPMHFLAMSIFRQCRRERTTGRDLESSNNNTGTVSQVFGSANTVDSACCAFGCIDLGRTGQCTRENGSEDGESKEGLHR